MLFTLQETPKTSSQGSEALHIGSIAIWVQVKASVVDASIVFQRIQGCVLQNMSVYGNPNFLREAPLGPMAAAMVRHGPGSLSNARLWRLARIL